MKILLMLAFLVYAGTLRALGSRHRALLQQQNAAPPPPVALPLSVAVTPANVRDILSRSPNEEWVRQLPRCVSMKATAWGLGSQLVTFLDAASLFRVHNYTGEFFLDYKDSTYQCATPDFFSFTSFFRGGDNSMASNFTPTCPADKDVNARGLVDLVIGPIRGEARYMAALLNVSRKPQLENGPFLSDAQWAQRAALIQPFHDEQCKVVEQMWRFSPEMGAIMRYDMASINNHPKPLVVVHNRRGDKDREYPEEYRKTYNATNAIERLLARHPAARGGTCVVVGDDGGLLDGIVSDLQRMVGCTILNRVTHGRVHIQENFYGKTAEHRCIATQRYIVDLQILATADYSIGPILSNVNTIASIVGRCLYQRDASTYFDIAGWPVDRLLWSSED